MPQSRANTGAPSGRALPGEYANYAEDDIARVPGDDITRTLEEQGAHLVSHVGALDEDRIRGLRYAPGKWTLKEVVGHLADDERIFAYRMLCVLRSDRRTLEGFDEKEYVAAARFEAQSLSELIEECRTVRAATVALLRGLTGEQWMRRGVVNGYEASVRGLAFHIAGHELRHLRTIDEKYLATSP